MNKQAQTISKAFLCDESTFQKYQFWRKKCLRLEYYEIKTRCNRSISNDLYFVHVVPIQRSNHFRPTDCRKTPCGGAAVAQNILSSFHCRPLFISVKYSLSLPRHHLPLSPRGRRRRWAGRPARCAAPLSGESRRAVLSFSAPQVDFLDDRSGGRRHRRRRARLFRAAFVMGKLPFNSQMILSFKAAFMKLQCLSDIS